MRADYEKLRMAKGFVKFNKENPDVQSDFAVYEEFISQNSEWLNREKAILWPADKDPRHWPGKDLLARCALLKSPWDQIYPETLKTMIRVFQLAKGSELIAERMHAVLHAHSATTLPKSKS